MGDARGFLRRSSLRRLPAGGALAMALAGVLTGCGLGGGGHPGLRAGALPVISLERLPGNAGTPGLQRVSVVRNLLQVQVAPRAATPTWRVVRRLTLTRTQERHLARDARAVRGWKKKPGLSCPIQAAGAARSELLLRVGRRATLCPPVTARALVSFLGTYLPPPTDV